MLFLEPSLLALYIVLLCSLHTSSSIQGCIDGWVEMERKERAFSFIRHVVLYLNVLNILSQNTFGFRTWDLLDKIVKEVAAAGRTALKILALHQELPKIRRVLLSMQTVEALCTWKSKPFVGVIGRRANCRSLSWRGWLLSYNSGIIILLVIFLEERKKTTRPKAFT